MTQQSRTTTRQLPQRYVSLHLPVLLINRPVVINDASVSIECPRCQGASGLHGEDAWFFFHQ